MLGIFDSGFGGLSVLRAVRRLLPNLDIVYLGDNARTPYGNRSRETVTRHTQECCSLLFDRGCSLIVLACNTASADTLRVLQTEWLPLVRETGNGKRETRQFVSASRIPHPASCNIIGVIRPLAEEAVSMTKNNRIAVVGTRGTVDSQAYTQELTKLKPEVTVLQQACPLRVPLVEEQWERKPETRPILRTYLANLKSQNPDVLILGCTHYEILHVLFKEKMGSGCTVLHSSSVIAEKLKAYLARHPEYQIARNGETHFLTTGDPERFSEVGKRFYGQDIALVDKVELGEFACQAKSAMLS